jgi:hypothetical protein
MKLILWFSLLGWLVGEASALDLTEKWIRHFTNFGIAAVFPDNRGHLAVAGNQSNSAEAILLDDGGWVVARSPAPIPSVSKAGADLSGRISLAAGGRDTNGLPLVYAANFDTFLSSVRWSSAHHLFPTPNPRIDGWGTEVISVAPDNDGNLDVLANWNGWWRQEFSFLKFGDSDVLQFDYPSDFGSNPYFGSALARSPDGSVFVVGNSIYSHYPEITVLKFSPAGTLLFGTNYDPGFFFESASDAVCDRDGNLIVVGSYTDDFLSLFRSRKGVTIKFDPFGRVLWRATNGPLYGDYSILRNRKVAVSKVNEIVVTGYAGTLKYSPIGIQLWSVPLSGDQMLVDTNENILVAGSFIKTNGLRGIRTTKLAPNGTTLWETTYSSADNADDHLAGITADLRGDVYLGINSAPLSTAAVVKYVERGRVPISDAAAAAAPVAMQPPPHSNQWRGVLPSGFAGPNDLPSLLLFDGTNFYFYNVSFDRPSQTAGQRVVTGLGASTPSAILFGEPAVVSSFGQLTNQPLVLVPWTGYQQLAFELAKQSPNYFVELDFETHSLIGSSFLFTIGLDGAQFINFHGLGEVHANGGTLLPTWIEDQRHHLRVEVDMVHDTWSWAFDDAAPQVGDLGWDAIDLSMVRLHAGYWTGGEVKPIWPVIAVDNVRIGTTEPPLAPIINCTGPAVLECSNGSIATVWAGVTDFGGHPLELTWSVDGVSVQTNRVPADSTITSSNVALVAELGPGVHSISVSASNGTPLTAACSTSVTVRDALPPEIRALVARPASLWPPDRTMKMVGILPDVVDLCDSARCRIVAVESNEPGTNQIQIVGDLAVRLRADHSQPKSNRVYTLTVECMDSSGSTSRSTTIVPVLPRRGEKP